MTLTDDVMQIAREAGAIILKYYAQPTRDTWSKKDFSPVTVADLEADECIRAGLLQALPGSAFVSEEVIDKALPTEAAIQLLAVSPWCWLVDPLDGTRDFLAGTDDFTVNIALVKRGVIDLGVMYAPARDLMYCAQRGHGSFQVTTRRERLPLTGRPWGAEVPKALVSRHHRAGEGEFLAEIMPACVVEPCGSALKYGYLAAGLADFALRRSPTSVWDTAAAQCILDEAGGGMFSRTGQPLQIWRDSLLNPPFLALADRSMEDLYRDKLLSVLPEKLR